MKGFKDFYLKAKAIIWPWLSYMCRVRSTAGRVPCGAVAHVAVYYTLSVSLSLTHTSSVPPSLSLSLSLSLSRTLSHSLALSLLLDSGAACADVCSRPGTNLVWFSQPSRDAQKLYGFVKSCGGLLQVDLLFKNGEELYKGTFPETDFCEPPWRQPRGRSKVNLPQMPPPRGGI